MHLAYRGSSFHGWQSQPNAPSVQTALEDALALLIRQPVAVTGAGRTDAGVNARMMIAHFDLPEELSSPQAVVAALNSLLGRDIAVYSIRRMHPEAHARFDATARTYRYYVHSSKSPFLYPLSWQAPDTLDYQRMNQAAETLLGVEDFTSFAKLHASAQTNICHVSKARWEPVGEGRHVFEITADRFLRNMVRAIVGTLVDVGRGKLSFEGFKQVVDARDRCSAGTSMPPHPLFLWEITYPYYSVD